MAARSIKNQVTCFKANALTANPPFPEQLAYRSREKSSRTFVNTKVERGISSGLNTKPSGSYSLFRPIISLPEKESAVWSKTYLHENGLLDCDHRCISVR